MKRTSMWTRLWAALLCAVLLQPWGAYRLFAADITPGYTFVSGEQNVTHTKLNNSAAGTINTTFYSGKGSAGADPNTAFPFLLLDTSVGIFKQTTLDAAVFQHSALLSARASKTAPVVGDALFMMDSAAGNAYKQMTWSNWLFSGSATGVPTNQTLFPTVLGGLAGSLNLSNLIGAATSHTLPTNGDAFLVLTENEGKGIRKLTLQNLITGAVQSTNYSDANTFLSWDGTRLRSTGGTNLVNYLREKYILVREEQASGTDAGAFNNGAWRTRVLNTKVSDVAGLASLATSQVTLTEGTYQFRGSAPVISVNFHQLRLQNVTDATTITMGMSCFTAGGGQGGIAQISGRFTIAAGKALELQHRCSVSVATTGFGAAASFGTEVYATLEFWREGQ